MTFACRDGQTLGDQIGASGRSTLARRFNKKQPYSSDISCAYGDNRGAAAWLIDLGHPRLQSEQLLGPLF
jgi:hypothetical protein